MPAKPGPATAAILRLLLLAAGLALAGVALRELAPTLLARSHGAAPHAATAASIATFLALATATCAVGLPRQAVCFAAGLAYGVWLGTALSLAATVLATLLDFAWARAAGGDWARRRLLARWPRAAAIDRLLSRNPFTAVLTLRLLPVGSALLLSLAAGLAGIPTLPFLAASALGALPQTAVFVLLGSGVGLGHLARILLAVALFAASALLGLLLMRRRRNELTALVSTGEMARS